MSELATKAKRIPSTRVPKYISIAESVKADIASGVLLPNDRLPSFGTMTKQFNVTIHTIDKAHTVLEQEGFVRREPGRGVFVEPQKNSRTGNIGLFLYKTDANDSYNRSFLGGIQEQARRYDLNVMLVDENNPTAANKTDGMLLYCLSAHVDLVQYPATMPRVLILEPATGIDIANVISDDFAGAQLATQHLLELGHKRISYMLSWATDSNAVRRLAGYRAALEEAGIAFDERLVRYMATSVSDYVMDTETAMANWLADGWQALESTAILSLSDDGVSGIRRALGGAGLKVPDDVSIVGYDGVTRPQLALQDLTTVEVPLREIGKRSVDLLFEQIQHGRHEVKQIVVPVKLKVGATSGAVRGV